MEHRWSLRAPLNAKVVLYRNSQMVAKCIASNIGQGGLFVNISIDIYLNSVLEFDLRLDTSHGSRRYFQRVSVVHVAKTGLGLMFLEANGDMFRTIRGILLDSAFRRSPISQLTAVHAV